MINSFGSSRSLQREVSHIVQFRVINNKDQSPMWIYPSYYEIFIFITKQDNEIKVHQYILAMQHN